jgi:hypothetical protein
MSKEQLELFPTEVGYELSPQEEIKEVSEIEQLPTIEDAEWCFQFFNNEPIVFAWQDKGVEPAPLVLQIQPKDGDGLNFQQNGMTFRIFPREISEETKLERKKQNESQNKEA